jgi:hypothetical protein
MISSPPSYICIPTLVHYDVDSVENWDLLLYNIQLMTGLVMASDKKWYCFRDVFKKFYIHAFSSNNQTSEKDLQAFYGKLEREISARYKADLSYVSGIDDLRQLKETYFADDIKILEIGANMMLSREFISQMTDFFAMPANIFLPMMIYKYQYTEVTVPAHCCAPGSGAKEYRVKKFLKSSTPFFQEYHPEEVHYVPGWNERLRMTSEIYTKMAGRLPVASPSPLLHDWPTYHNVLLHNSDKRAIIANSRFAVHQFQYVKHSDQTLEEEEM